MYTGTYTCAYTVPVHVYDECLCMRVHVCVSIYRTIHVSIDMYTPMTLQPKPPKPSTQVLAPGAEDRRLASNQLGTVAAPHCQSR